MHDRSLYLIIVELHVTLRLLRQWSVEDEIPVKLHYLDGACQSINGFCLVLTQTEGPFADSIIYLIAEDDTIHFPVSLK